MKRLFVGDLHGDLFAAQRAMIYAADHGCRELIQCGDWGFLWPSPDGSIKNMPLFELEHLLDSFDMTMRFCDGNHDVHPHLRSIDNQLTERIVYQPRGSLVESESDGIRIAFLGGAASIDYRHRTPGKSWWPEEEITDEEVQRAVSHGFADILVSHDAPVMPEGFGPSGDVAFDLRSQASNAKVMAVARGLGVSLVVHGHWHKRYSSFYTVDGGQSGFNIEGLNCNYVEAARLCLVVDGTTPL